MLLLNELKIVALKLRCSDCHLSPVIQEWFFLNQDYVAVVRTKSSARFSWLNQRQIRPAGFLFVLLYEEWMTLCWSCGSPQSVITCKNILQGVSVRRVITTYRCPVHIPLQIRFFGLAGGVFLPSHVQITIISSYEEYHCETREYTNNKSDVYGSTLVFWFIVAQSTIASFFIIRIWWEDFVFMYINS